MNMYYRDAAILFFIFAIIMSMLVVYSSCSSTYRPHIIDIRDEPYPIDWSPRQPDKFADKIMEFNYVYK